MIRLFKDLSFIELKTNEDEISYSRRLHSHKTLSIGLILEGSTIIDIEGLDFSLEPNDIIVIPPGKAHLCKPKCDKKFKFYMAYIDPEWIYEFIGIDCNSLNAFRTKKNCAIETSLIKLYNSDIGHKWEIDFIESCDLLFHNDDLEIEVNSFNHKELENAHQKIVKNPEYHLSLNDLAAISGLSKFNFIRKYKSVYGLTPHASQINQRVQYAINLLKKGHISLSNIAYECGFSDQSHFNRIFKLYTGQKPSNYLKAILSNT